MHLIADAPDIEDHIILAVAVDQALPFADHGWYPGVDAELARLAPLLPSPLQGRDGRSPLSGGGGGGLRVSASRLPPSPPLPHKGGGSALCAVRVRIIIIIPPSYPRHLQPQRRARAVMRVGDGDCKRVAGVGRFRLGLREADFQS